MRLVLLVSFLVVASLSMAIIGSSGERRFFGGHAWLVGGKEKARKGSGKKDKLN